MFAMMKFIKICTYAMVLLSTAASIAFAHSERGEKRPQTFEEAFIPWTKEEFAQGHAFRHPPGNIYVDNMYELFAGKVLVVDRGGKTSTVPGVVNHAVKVIFFGKDHRYIWCSYGSTSDYYHRVNNWAPVRWKHGEFLIPLLNTATETKSIGISPLYDGNTGQIVWYAYPRKKKKWFTWNPGHLQERLPAVVYTLCPDFPSAEELGVNINRKQTATTYDKMLEQDRGQRVLRPDLITLNPVEIIE